MDKDLHEPIDQNIIKRIFFDEHCHWDRFYEKHKKRIRPVVVKEIEKFRKCGDSRSGFTLFACPACGNLKVVAHRCKSRFCTTCSTGFMQEWSRKTAEEMYQVRHRHLMFTMDERLWPLFAKYRDLLKDLMDLSVKLIRDWFAKKYKVTIGVLAGLHTFGARMNFNPHVHMLVTEGGVKANGEWKSIDFIPYQMLRKRWQAAVLALLRKKLPQKEYQRHKSLLNQVYKENPEGFVIYGPPNKKGSIREQIAYIGRYIKRPAIAARRILAYDGEHVTFSYFDKTEQVEKEETIAVEEFISRLIRHIPDAQFKTIRYYGLYARRTKAMWKKIVAVGMKTKASQVIVNLFSVFRKKTWRQQMKEKTGKDPLECSRCKEVMEYKGEVCLHEGKLRVKYAVCRIARARMEELIVQYESGIQAAPKEVGQKEKTFGPADQRHPNRRVRMLAV